MKTIKLILILCISVISLLSCEKESSENTPETNAIIQGYDLSLCACCGGWIINIEGNEDRDRFSQLPANSGIDLDKAEFPLSVKIEWSESDAFCDRGIIIESIQIIE